MAKDYHHHTSMVRVHKDDIEYLNELHRLDPYSQSRMETLHRILTMHKAYPMPQQTGKGNVTILE